MGWEIHPQGLRDIVTVIHRDYGAPQIIITENGLAHDDRMDRHGRVRDTYRIEYIKAHLEQLSLAIADGANVRGYRYWSLRDNLEWDRGWGQRFGLIHVDDDTLKRTIKDSGRRHRDFITRAARIAQQGEPGFPVSAVPSPATEAAGSSPATSPPAIARRRA